MKLAAAEHDYIPLSSIYCITSNSTKYGVFRHVTNYTEHNAPRYLHDSAGNMTAYEIVNGTAHKMITVGSTHGEINEHTGLVQPQNADASNTLRIIINKVTRGLGKNNVVIQSMKRIDIQLKDDIMKYHVVFIPELSMFIGRASNSSTVMACLKHRALDQMVEGSSEIRMSRDLDLLPVPELDIINSAKSPPADLLYTADDIWIESRSISKCENLIVSVGGILSSPYDNDHIIMNQAMSPNLIKLIITKDEQVVYEFETTTVKLNKSNGVILDPQHPGIDSWNMKLILFPNLDIARLYNVLAINAYIRDLYPHTSDSHPDNTYVRMLEDKDRIIADRDVEIGRKNNEIQKIALDSRKIEVDREQLALDHFKIRVDQEMQPTEIKVREKKLRSDNIKSVFTVLGAIITLVGGVIAITLKYAPKST